MNLPAALLWGFAATTVLTTLMAGSQVMGLSRMSIPFLLGTMVTPDRDRAMLAGIGIHFVNGWIFALLYVLAFEALHRATWWLGALAGLLHGLFVLVVVLPLLPAVHPRMASERQGPTPTRLLQPPGFLAIHYGRRTPIIALIAHVAYGILLGALYVV
ncbi:MAG: hypothetical protein IRZ00_05650 [Gemmatimonadetes bacterium]|nr:hypothetical protein [Gemmatimonadota bacterium]